MRIFFMILIVIFCVSTAFCEVFYIPDDHPTISSAYQVISENDTICLRSGIHYDNVQIDSMDINIISESGSDSTRLCPLDPQQAIFYGTGTELIFLGDIAIKGIRFDSLSQTGIFDLAGESEPPFSEVLIDSCEFHENSVDPIIKIQHRNITIKDCLFSNNHSNLSSVTYFL